MSKLTKPTGGFGEKVYQMKRRHLAIINQKIKDIRDGKMEGDISELEEQKLLIFSGFETEAKIRAQIADDFYEANGTYPSKDYVDNQLEKRKQALEGNAAGGMPNRVNRVGLQESFPGTAGDAQQVMQPTQNMQGMTTGQDQAMTQDPYQILRRRLPPEVSDDVVRLIAYNKEAFQDFANIQTQDDVTMFNDKWGVQLVVDVGSA
jgi:hypothetical protein